ncbi:methylmalonyl Co-A mutase-associated GTPase MeaB [Marinifilum sp. N1E240]|uniref:methylmalonyl Co-A mutase-associated GTPase MeaB n=1 Tax=Marinifilum sp. N1E240 TaxID=2608082 RepID=UPI00128B4C15|nr:methylmalonyl Co-A mutase-associated GTPase MeaB [Marinifilum sp. N1E240]MPQ47579.1 methylmalonyl Co-A mutase-associated GTPase MeaB [Marinifilum sp. N1E240]
MSDNKKKNNGHIENNPSYKGLKVNSGISQPPSINPRIAERLKKNKRRKYSIEDYVKGILAGDRGILSQAITLIESSKYEHQKIAQEIIERCLPYSGKSVRIGITGVPGAGKSTFIEAFGKHVTGQGNKLAVLAIDPSSERSKGSILGDKTRMEELSVDANAYIRPSPSAGSLGGVARKTRESLILCEAAGFDTILIETVGVGQSETAVHSMVDFFLLIKIAGAGDELQGIKRGIMEMADAISINKADGNNVHKAQLARVQFENALHLFPQSPSGWTPKVLTCSSLEKTGIDTIWDNILEYCSHTQQNGYFEQRRSEQAKYWMYETINEQLKDGFYQQHLVKEQIPEFEEKVLNDEMSSFVAAYKLLDAYFGEIKNKE